MLQSCSGGGIRAALGRLAAVALVTSVGLSAVPAGAATLVDFNGEKFLRPYQEEGFTFAKGRISRGAKCVDGGCLGLNKRTTVMTSSQDSGTFTLAGFTFRLVGKRLDNKLTVTGSNGKSLSFLVKDYSKKAFHTVDFGNVFADVDSISFTTGGKGRARVDNVVATATPAPVPLPAAGLLLVGGMGVLGGLSRRRRAAA